MAKKIADLEAKILQLQEKLAKAKAEEMPVRLEAAAALQRWHAQVTDSHEEIDATEKKVLPFSVRTSEIMAQITETEKELEEAVKKMNEAQGR